MVIAELDLTKLVSPATLEGAAEQIARRAERRRKAAKEAARQQREQRERERETQQLASKAGKSTMAIELELLSMDKVRSLPLIATDGLPCMQVSWSCSAWTRYVHWR